MERYNRNNDNNDLVRAGWRGPRNAEENRLEAVPARGQYRGQRQGFGGFARQERPENGGANRNRNRQNQSGPFRPLEINLSFHRLRDLQPKEPADVVAALSYSKEGLSRLLQNEGKLTTDRHMMRLLLGCLSKVCQCQSMPAQKNEILNVVRTSECLTFLGTFLAASSGENITELGHIIGESADLLKALLTLFPSHVHQVLMVQAFMEMAQKQAQLRGAGNWPPDVESKVKDYEVVRDAAMESLSHRQKGNQRGAARDEDSLTPPDDFRQMSVFPTMEDLDKDKLPFLRKNKQVGGYISVEHYLDVQFRLLREDFVFPLREGIAEYLEKLAEPQIGKKRLKDIRVIHDVHILRAVCLSSGLSHRLTFDTTGLERVRWEVSKRLIFGSLVCLSADNFRTLYFATVVNRDPKDLRKGIVDVTFQHDLQEISAIPTDTSFTMAETTAFFEAYRPVLLGLQQIGEDDLPFQKYIVHCHSTVAEPVYLTRMTKYDLRPLVEDEVKLREDRRLVEQRRAVPYAFSSGSRQAGSVAVLYRELWPDGAMLQLDDTQFQALHCALTKEFSVIQGPPGTGKTYVGLKIARALLHNRRAWDPELDSCMLVVCYTNHALDQFLEGITSFFSGKVVRVGSRIRSEKLEQFSLSNLRHQFRHQKHGEVDRLFREITRLRFQGHERMEMLKTEIDSMGLMVESARREIPHEDVLQPFMADRHYTRLTEQRVIMQMQAQGGFIQQGRTRRPVMAMPVWLGINGLLNNAGMNAEDLMQLQQDLGDDVLDIEGDIQAQEDRHRLDTDDFRDRNAWQKKERERKTALARERNSLLAVDISSLDQVQEVDGEGFQLTRDQRKRLKRHLRRTVTSEDRMTDLEERQVRDVWALDQAQRWRLYRHWTNKLCQRLQQGLREKEREYDEMARRHQETLMQEDKHILKTATIIAMTTTGAARYQSILQEVKPKVIVVEEAAEVLEGHVITTLSKECQHLILIGDHKQLRPNPTVFALARKYNLELSLFERMINNHLKCNTLGWQHRMRPEIAALVKPIYPDLNNHPSVEGYEDVKGVSSNLFFINHSHPEKHDLETKSHSNQYEAEYLAQLCLYLLKQGYDSSRITVLTTYSGQLYQLRRLMPKNSMFDGVRVTVVDNFQGEENDIILLSLVRSNDDGNIGFLKIENRVCVALSRAKMGLYVIGNFELLSESSDLWRSITTKLRDAGKMGDTLKLYCQNHPRDEGLAIKTPTDFHNAPEGGCMKPCTARLNCGHVCTRLCHPYDKDHKGYKCTKKCEQTLDCAYKHRCQKQCHEACGKCFQRVQKAVPRCGHVQWMSCGKDPKDHICEEPCQSVLSCGHRCGDRCGMPHRCFERVEMTWACGHTAEVQCAKTAHCPLPCGQQLSCGHECKGSCTADCHGGRLHKRCKHKCTRILVCGHECGDTCSYCPPCDQRCENSCVHSSCQNRCGQPCTPCMEPCEWRCPHYSCTKLCSEPCDRPRCDRACRKKLQKCGHDCIGLCGEPCPKLCRICDAKEVTDIFFGTEDDPNARFVQLEDCEHIVEVSALDQWMTTTTDAKEDSVQLKACPFCKTPIRRNLRYGQIIKTVLRDIEVAKRLMLGQEDKMQTILFELKQMTATRTYLIDHDLAFFNKKQEILEVGDSTTLGGLVAMQNQMKLLEETKKLKAKMLKVSRRQSFSKALTLFEEWICSSRLVFSDQESTDAERELTRLTHWLSLLFFREKAPERHGSIPVSVLNAMDFLIKNMKEGLKYTQTRQDTVTELLKKLEKLIPASGLGISDKERTMIVKAMDLSPGHWFKCPKGHIYAIGDCGGATVESRCPECKSTIGGTSHRLREDNTLATEMDGARHAAWSEFTNLQNFRLDDLM